MSFQMRVPCVSCGHNFGSIENRNGQDVVLCGDCGKYQYCAPKTETGRAVRTVKTTHAAISPKQRMRIIERANGRCEICGTRGNVHVGHVISVIDGHRLGLGDDVLNSDENLICECEECNLGGGAQTLPLRMFVAILRSREKPNDEPQPA